MKSLRIYLDTSILNFLFAEDVPHYCTATREFFDGYVSRRVHTAHVSSVVLEEIAATPNVFRRDALVRAIVEYGVDVLHTADSQDEIARLAQVYLTKKVLPKGEVRDALHIAVATVFGMDVLLSWNFRHLANVNRETKVNATNLAEGYNKPLRICTPLEVLSDES
ncbi:MAG: hypothetical protein HUU46_22355 [Candidatus Hydrogenedentes bacterium]|nr:hypothetical protein [Candidatus Hydrogenedentota bacterium]